MHPLLELPFNGFLSPAQNLLISNLSPRMTAWKIPSSFYQPREAQQKLLPCFSSELVLRKRRPLRTVDGSPLVLRLSLGLGLSPHPPWLAAVQRKAKSGFLEVKHTQDCQSHLPAWPSWLWGLSLQRRWLQACGRCLHWEPPASGRRRFCTVQHT